MVNSHTGFCDLYFKPRLCTAVFESYSMTTFSDVTATLAQRMRHNEVDKTPLSGSPEIFSEHLDLSSFVFYALLT